MCLLHIFYQKLCAIVDVITPVPCMYSISLQPHSLLVILMKADRNNKMKEIERDWETEMKKWMNKSADWDVGLMECLIIGHNAK